MQTYDFIDSVYRKRFPGHPLRWAFTSRMVRRHHRKQRRKIESPAQVMAQLAQQGHAWAAVQSLHISSGHEFYRLLEEIEHPHIRASMGLPLLHQVDDYHALMQLLEPVLPDENDAAALFVGHGTDHPIWTAYTALHHLLQRNYPKRAYIGLLEGGFPEIEALLPELRAARLQKILLVPLMLVAGMHFKEDLAGDGDSWKTLLERKGFAVELLDQGVGMMPPVVDLFCSHTREAIALCESLSDLR
jgi:sirohydrochlorin cobaltochelatase